MPERAGPTGSGRRRAVVVGCGWVSGVWLDVLSRRDDVDVVAFVDPKPDAAEARARAWGSGRVAASLGEALRAGDADLVLNLTPTDHHVEVSVEALRAGLDVLTEKPLAPTLAGALEIVRAAAETGRTASVMQNRRYEPTFRSLRSFVAEQAAPLLLCADLFTAWTFGGTLEEAPSPLLDDMAIHSFDQARALAGARPVWAHCHELAVARSWLAGAPTAAACFGFENGTVFAYRGSWSTWGHETSWNGSWRVVGSGSSALWDGESEPEVVSPPADAAGRPAAAGASGVRIPARGNGSGHELCLAEMLTALAERRPSETDAADNLLSVAMVEAARLSTRDGHRVDFGELELR